jgi:uncharacterized caspase-like protein
MVALRLFAVLAVLLIAIPGFASAEQRVALVIGNSGYQSLPRLTNPVNDARAMAAALAADGFELIGGGPQLDLDRPRMERAIRDFGRRLGADSVGLFYYAGHGVQVNGSNYLVPITAT